MIREDNGIQFERSSDSVLELYMVEAEVGTSVGEQSFGNFRIASVIGLV
jgi:hypothetical protein